MLLSWESPRLVISKSVPFLQKKAQEEANQLNPTDLVCRNVDWNCLDGKGSSPFPDVHKTSTYIMYGACNPIKIALQFVFSFYSMP